MLGLEPLTSAYWYRKVKDSINQAKQSIVSKVITTVFVTYIPLFTLIDAYFDLGHHDGDDHSGFTWLQVGDDDSFDVFYHSVYFFWLHASWSLTINNHNRIYLIIIIISYFSLNQLTIITSSDTLQSNEMHSMRNYSVWRYHLLFHMDFSSGMWYFISTSWSWSM